MDEEGESELTELLNTPKAQKPDRNVLMKRQQGVPKNAAIQPMQSARPTMSAQEQGRTTSGSMPGVLHLHTLLLHCQKRWEKSNGCGEERVLGREKDVQRPGEISEVKGKVRRVGGNG